MGYYPVFLELDKKRCLVVGGGKVAERKVASLLSEGALVTVVSPALNEGLTRLKKEKKIKHLGRRYREGDLQGFFIAVSASSSGEVNRAVSAEAEKRGVLVNIADAPGLCSFITPAVLERGALKIAVSTSGKSPFFSKKLRGDLEKTIGEEYSVFVEILGAVRNKLLKEKRKDANNKRIYAALSLSSVPEWIKLGDSARIDDFLVGLLGEGYSLSMLGVKLKK